MLRLDLLTRASRLRLPRLIAAAREAARRGPMISPIEARLTARTRRPRGGTSAAAFMATLSTAGRR